MPCVKAFIKLGVKGVSSDQGDHRSAPAAELDQLGESADTCGQRGTRSVSIQPAYGAIAFAGSPGLVFDGVRALWNLAISKSPAARNCIAGLTLASTERSSPGTASVYYVLRISLHGSLEVSVANAAVRVANTAFVTIGNPLIIVSQISASNYNFRQSGVGTGAGVPDSVFSSPRSNVAIGGYGSGNRWSGALSTLLVYDSNLTFGDCERAEGWGAHTLGRMELLYTEYLYRLSSPKKHAPL